MVVTNSMFWLFLAVVIVATLTFVSVIVWVEARRKEREEFYRFEFRKRLVEAGTMDADAFASLVRYEQELALRSARQKILVAAAIFLGIGIGACFGLQFISGSIWKLGFIPAGIGVCMLVVGLLAGKPNLGPPPLGTFPEPGDEA